MSWQLLDLSMLDRWASDITCKDDSQFTTLEKICASSPISKWNILNSDQTTPKLLCNQRPLTPVRVVCRGWTPGCLAPGPIPCPQTRSFWCTPCSDADPNTSWRPESTFISVLEIIHRQKLFMTLLLSVGCAIWIFGGGNSQEPPVVIYTDIKWWLDSLSIRLLVCD